MSTNSFRDYCRSLTDAQLEDVLQKEWDAQRDPDYMGAVIEAASRGWEVQDGKRIA